MATKADRSMGRIDTARTRRKRATLPGPAAPAPAPAPSVADPGAPDNAGGSGVTAENTQPATLVPSDPASEPEAAPATAADSEPEPVPESVTEEPSEGKPAGDPADGPASEQRPAEDVTEDEPPAPAVGQSMPAEPFIPQRPLSNDLTLEEHTSNAKPLAQANAHGNEGPSPAAGRGDTGSAARAVKASYLDARLQPRSWVTKSIRYPDEVYDRLVVRMATDRESTGRAGLGVNHYVNAALNRAPSTAPDALKLAQQELERNDGEPLNAKSHSTRIHGDIAKRMSRLETQMRVTSRFGLYSYFVTAALRIFLDDLDAEETANT